MPRNSRAPVTRLAALTAFERRILALLADGASRGEIARAVNLAPKTVSNILTSAKEKVGARSIVQAAVVVALEATLVNGNLAG